MQMVDTSHLMILHGVINRHAVGHGTAGAVDIKLDVLIGVLGLEVEQLRHDKAGGRVGIDLLAEHDDTVIEQAGEDVVGRSPRAVCSTTYGTKLIYVPPWINIHC